MKPPIPLILFILFTLSISAHGQDTIFFKKDYSCVNQLDSYTIPLYKLNEDSIKYRGKPYKIIIPQHLDTSNLAFCFEYFTGWDSMKIPKSPAILVSGYKDFHPEIYTDANHNHDFTDDGEPYILNGQNDSVLISYSNYTNPNAQFNIRLKFVEFKSQETKDRVEEFYTKHRNGKGNILLNSKFWFSGMRHNSLITRDQLNGDSILIGILDYNCNGFFNDRRDRIMIGNFSLGFISDLKSKGCYVNEDTTIVKINSRFYKIEDIEETGDYIVLGQTNLRSDRLEVGDTIPNLDIQLVDGSNKRLHDVLSQNHFTLIDIWGTWCQGCIQQTEELLKLDSTYNYLNIVALNSGDSKETLHKYIEKNDIKWINGYSSKEINSILLVDSYPYLLLLNQRKEVVLMQTRIDDVKKVIEGDLRHGKIRITK